jgi:hypothetical protein
MLGCGARMVAKFRLRGEQIARTLICRQERTEDAALQRLVQADVVMTSSASIAGQWAGLRTTKGGQTLGIIYEMVSG